MNVIPYGVVLVFLSILATRTETMKHTTPARITFFDDAKPNPATSINMLPTANRIVETILVVCSLIVSYLLRVDSVQFTVYSR